jgi:acetolactate synthase-1/2/3 large subunit
MGTDAFQEADATGITRPCTKYSWLVKDVNQLAIRMHQAFVTSTTPTLPVERA